MDIIIAMIIKRLYAFYDKMNDLIGGRLPLTNSEKPISSSINMLKKMVMR